MQGNNWESKSAKYESSAAMQQAFPCTFSGIVRGERKVIFTEQALTGVCHGEIQSRCVVRIVPRR